MASSRHCLGNHLNLGSRFSGTCIAKINFTHHSINQIKGQNLICYLVKYSEFETPNREITNESKSPFCKDCFHLPLNKHFQNHIASQPKTQVSVHWFAMHIICLYFIHSCNECIIHPTRYVLCSNLEKSCQFTWSEL